MSYEIEGAPAPQNIVFPLPQDRNAMAERAQRVIDLGLMLKRNRCPQPVPDTSLPVNVQIQMALAAQPPKQALQSFTTINPATVFQGQSGASLGPSDFVGSPVVVPMNVSPETAIQANPQALAIRRDRKRRAASQNIANSPGIQWGTMPATIPGSSCGTPGSWMDWARANPWAALLLGSGLGVIVYAAAKR